MSLTWEANFKPYFLYDRDHVLGRYRFLIFKSRARYHLEELREARNDAGENLSVQLKY